MDPQSRSQKTLQMVAVLALAAATWMIAAASHAAKPSEASLKASGRAEETREEAASEPAQKPAETRKTDTAERRSYTVQPGDSLSEIAETHGVSLEALLEANGIDNPDRVDAGKELAIPDASQEGKDRSEKKASKAKAKRKGPEGVRITVPKDVTLKRIADVYGIPWKRIAKANNLGPAGRVRAGQKLFIPGAKEVLEILPCLKPEVELYRVRTDETRRVSLCRCNGEVDPKGLEVLSELAAPPRQAIPFPLHERLARLLQKVAETYPGKRIEIVSGQRLPKQSQKNESLHNRGRAIDFRVAGIGNKRLVETVRGFGNVGVGYYPSSVFIHMDTREKDGFWIDYSRPGEKAIYGRAGMSQSEIDAIRLARRSAEEGEPATETDVEAETDVGALSEPPPPPAEGSVEAKREESPSPAPEAAVPSPVAVNVSPAS